MNFLECCNVAKAGQYMSRSRWHGIGVQKVPLKPHSKNFRFPIVALPSCDCCECKKGKSVKSNVDADLAEAVATGLTTNDYTANDWFVVTNPVKEDESVKKIAVVESDKDKAKAATKKSVKKASGKLVKQSSKKAVKKAVKKSVKKSVKKAVKK